MDGELSPRARRLVELAMAQDAPPDEVAQDSWGIVISRITADAQRIAEAPPRATEPRRGRARTIAIVAAVCAFAAIGVWWTTRAPTQPPSAPAKVERTRAPTPAKPTPATLPAERPAGEPSAAQLLDDAERSAATEPLTALELIDRHATIAPSSDADRRMALRIEVLCALGRDEDARGEAQAFLGRPRAEPWVTRVRKSCGAATPGTPPRPPGAR